MNVCQESLPILTPVNLLLGLWLDFTIFALLAHKNSPPQILDGLTCIVTQFTCPELQSLSYS